jgi:hypothetical protein
MVRMKYIGTLLIKADCTRGIYLFLSSAHAGERAGGLRPLYRPPADCIRYTLTPVEEIFGVCTQMNIFADLPLVNFAPTHPGGS